MDYSVYILLKIVTTFYQAMELDARMTNIRVLNWGSGGLARREGARTDPVSELTGPSSAAEEAARPPPPPVEKKKRPWGLEDAECELWELFGGVMDGLGEVLEESGTQAGVLLFADTPARNRMTSLAGRTRRPARMGACGCWMSSPRRLCSDLFTAKEDDHWPQEWKRVREGAHLARYIHR